MRPLRQFLPDRAYLITARCFDERFFLSPDSGAVTSIVATALAQAAEKYRLDVFAYVVMSNHLHFVIRAPFGGLPDAMQLVLSQVARRVNRLRGRNGPVFADRYHHQTICDDDALRTAIRYVILNPVRAGAAASPGAWPGLSSYADTCEGRSLVCVRRTRGPYVEWTTAHMTAVEMEGSSKHPTDASRFEERFVLKCHSAALDAGVAMPAALKRFATEIAAKRRDVGSAPFESSGQARPAPNAHDRPPRPRRARAPACIASSSASRRQFMTERRAFMRAYRTASALFRRGEHGTFPPGCCLPWPRISSLTGCSDTFANGPFTRRERPFQESENSAMDLARAAPQQPVFSLV